MDTCGTQRQQQAAASSQVIVTFPKAPCLETYTGPPPPAQGTAQKPPSQAISEASIEALAAGARLKYLRGRHSAGLC